MDIVGEAIAEWSRLLLSQGIRGGLGIMFQGVNARVGEIAEAVGTPPQDWNSGIFALLKNLSETVILPVAGIIIAFALCYELTSMIMEKNNMRDFDTFVFVKFAAKAFAAVLLVSHTFDLTMAVFRVAQDVVQKSAGLIHGTGEIRMGAAMENLDVVLAAMPFWELALTNAHVWLINFAMMAISIGIMILLYIRMVEIYMLCAIGPIPMATLMNRELGEMGRNYLKGIAALAFQGFFIMVCVAIYTVLVDSIASTGNLVNDLWICTGYTILLFVCLLKSGSFSKSVFNAR